MKIQNLFSSRFLPHASCFMFPASGCLSALASAVPNDNGSMHMPCREKIFQYQGTLNISCTKTQQQLRQLGTKSRSLIKDFVGSSYKGGGSAYRQKGARQKGALVPGTFLPPKVGARHILRQGVILRRKPAFSHPCVNLRRPKKKICSPISHQPESL